MNGAHIFGACSECLEPVPESNANGIYCAECGKTRRALYPLPGVIVKGCPTWLSLQIMRDVIGSAAVGQWMELSIKDPGRFMPGPFSREMKLAAWSRRHWAAIVSQVRPRVAEEHAARTTFGHPGPTLPNGC